MKSRRRGFEGAGTPQMSEASTGIEPVDMMYHQYRRTTDNGLFATRSRGRDGRRRNRRN